MKATTLTLDEQIIEIIQNVGRNVKDNAFNVGRTEWKGQDNPVTQLDKWAERTFRQEIAAVIDANFAGEEYGYQDNGAEYTFLIDPIDGTKSFIRGDFLSSVSVGVEYQGQLVGGFVYDFMKDVMYVGWQGECYIMHNDEKHDFHKRHPFRKISLHLHDVEEDAPLFKEAHNIKVMKRGGSIALMMAELAAGNYDGMVVNPKHKGGPWDIAAGMYLMQCNNVHMQDYQGRELNHRDSEYGLVALHQNVKDEVLRYMPHIKKKQGVGVDDSLLVPTAA